MGWLAYGSANSDIEMDDRLLAHVQAAIVTKLRRNEQFLLTWDHTVGTGAGHSSIWIHPAIALHFRYSGGRHPALNRAWLDSLLSSANSAGGLQITPEPRQEE
ncbi:MAG: ATP-dependent ligase [Microbacteriaceae bacterium]|nr:ATP-dependent ligase [Microbacteriaceae bacterium]